MSLSGVIHFVTQTTQNAELDLGPAVALFFNLPQQQPTGIYHFKKK